MIFFALSEFRRGAIDFFVYEYFCIFLFNAAAHNFAESVPELTSQLTLYREVIVVCSQIHIKHIHTVCGQNVELLNVKVLVLIVTTGL